MKPIMVHLASNFILGLLERFFSHVHSFVLAKVVNHFATRVVRQNILLKALVVAGKILPVSYLQVYLSKLFL